MEGTLPITINADAVAELDEKFLVQLTRVDVTGEAPSPQNSPFLGEKRNASVTILANDDTYGAFTVYSDSPLATDDGHRIEVEEKQNLAVDLSVERRGNCFNFAFSTMPCINIVSFTINLSSNPYPNTLK